MSFLANNLYQTSGPTTLLARQATVVGIAVPPWPLLSQAEGRRRLTERLCGALRRDSAEAPWQTLNEPADQPGNLFLARLLAEVAIVLQNVAGHPVSRARALADSNGRGCQAVWEYLVARTGRAAGKGAADLITLAAGPQGLAEEEVPFEKVSACVTQVSSAVGNGVVEVLLEGAYKRNIPWQMVDPVWPMIAFGQGTAMRRLMTTIAETQGHISTLFTQDKMLSLQVLREAGFPVPRHHRVQSADQAAAAAKALGFPVVVKPVDLMRSQGVSINLNSEEAVRKAFGKARALSGAILVEDHLPGPSYRILVIGGRAQAAMQRCVPMVVGDGSADVRNLIEMTNQERALAALGAASAPRRINVENFKDELAPCLAEQNLNLDSVPAAGHRVRLAFMSETGRGGENVDVTVQMHPDNLAMAERVAQVLETPVLGLDFISADISRSYKAGNCGINEVNCEPALSLHQRATSSPRDVVTPYLDMVFGSGGNGCIPIVCSLGDKAAVFILLQAALAALGLQTGFAKGDDFAKVGRYRLPATAANPRPAGRILADCRIDCALIQLASGDFDSGLAFDRCTAVYLPQRLEPAAPTGGFDVAQARLLTDEIAETVILPLQDYVFWDEQVDLSQRRVILLSQDSAEGTAGVTAAPRGGVEILQARKNQTLDIYHHYGGHLDRLLGLDVTEGDPSRGDIEALLLATAGLLAMGRPPRDIVSSLTATWRDVGHGK